MTGAVDAAAALPQLGIALAFLVGYVLWSRFYFRAADPAVRRWVGARVGGTVVWMHRDLAWGFRLRAGRWAWGVRQDEGRISARDGVVYLLCILWVYVLCGLGPVALFFGVAFATPLLSVWAIYPVAFGIIPIYSRWWSGRRALPGMEEPDEHRPASA